MPGYDIDFDTKTKVLMQNEMSMDHIVKIV
jgi:hypothetical protein